MAADPSLNALVAGRLAAWRGLPPGADVAWARDCLPDVVEDLDGSLLIWHGGVAGPEGVLIWVDAGYVQLVEMPNPDLTHTVLADLGEPELVLPTGWSRVGRQLAWPTRGLAIHVALADVIRVMAFSSMPSDLFRTHRYATSGRPPRRP